MIKSAYRNMINDEVFVFNRDGIHMPQYDGKLENVRDRVVENLASNAEFYVSRWGQGNFEKVTRERWFAERGE